MTTRQQDILCPRHRKDSRGFNLCFGCTMSWLVEMYSERIIEYKKEIEKLRGLDV